MLRNTFEKNLILQSDSYIYVVRKPSIFVMVWQQNQK